MSEDVKTTVDKLLKLYYEGRDMTDAFIVRYEDLVDDRFDKALKPASFLLPNPLISEDNAQRALDEYDAFKSLSDDVEKSCNDWTATVGDILKETPLLLFQFDDPSEKGYLYGRSGLKDIPPHIKNIEHKISETQMRVSALKKIIPKVTEDTKQPAVLSSEQPRHLNSKVAYKLEYDPFKGALTLNEVLVLTPRLESTTDQAFQEAFKNPNTSVKVAGSMSSTIGNLKMPPILKKIMFRCSKGTFRVNPTITEDDLRERSIDKLAIDQELRKLTQ